VGVSRLRSFVGSKFIRKVAVRNTSYQYFKGIEALANKARANSTI
jgi:hypothetical protein